MKNNKTERLYNILLPIWLIIFLPTYIWIVLIPLNYLIDRVVLRWSLGSTPDKGLFCRKHTWKICLAGFLSDLIGALILLAVMLLAGDSSKAQSLIYAVTFDPFSKFAGLLIVVAAIAVSGVCIYFIDKWILGKTGLDAEQVKRSAIRLAIITAPYLYLLPSRLLYESGAMGL